MYEFLSMIFSPTGKHGGNKGEGLFLIFFYLTKKIGQRFNVNPNSIKTPPIA